MSVQMHDQLWPIVSVSVWLSESKQSVQDEEDRALLLSAERSDDEQRKLEAQVNQKASAAAVDILINLQSLPWCRIDCSFKGTTFPFFAHNLIQVTREWINWEGEDMTKAVADHFCKLEEHMNRLQKVANN